MNSLDFSKQLEAIFADGALQYQERCCVLCCLLRTVKPLLHSRCQRADPVEIHKTSLQADSESVCRNVIVLVGG